MVKNIANSGRIIRLVIAILLLVYAYWQKSWIAFLFGGFILFEAAMSWCVIYQILGRNSCPSNKKK